MAIIITDQANTIKFDLGNGEEHHIDKEGISVKKKFGSVYVYGDSEETTGFTKLRMKYTDVSSPVVVSNTDLIDTILGYKVSSGIVVGDVRITDGVEIVEVNPDGSTNIMITDPTGKVMTLEDNNSLRVTIQDQTTPIVMVPLTLLEQSTTLSALAVYGEITITVTSPTGIVAGKYITIFDPTAVRYSIFRCVSILASVVTIDSPLDFAYPSGSFVDVSDSNMAVVGSSVSPITFGVRNNAGAVPPPGLELSLDITRIMFTCITTSAVDLSKFADIAALTNGIVLRKRDGETYNIFNVKQNFGLAGIMYDWTVHSAQNLQQGQHGFLGRLTFAGQNKMGAVVRLAINEDLELIVQDDLSDILELSVIAEGSIVL